MSQRPSRIHRNRQRNEWRGQSQPENEEHPDELPRLPDYTDDDDCLEERKVADCGHRPKRARAPIQPRVPSAGPDHHGETPGKLRHLKVAAERGHLEAMYLLAQECEDCVARIHWLTLAAERGHVPAMHDLGLASAALHERRRWLLRAAQHGWAESMAELGDVECS
jgi:hypothetical protein